MIITITLTRSIQLLKLTGYLDDNSSLLDIPFFNCFQTIKYITWAVSCKNSFCISCEKAVLLHRLICIFVFAYAKRRFSHNEARITTVFSSPEPKAHRWAYRIPMDPASVVLRPSSSVHIFKRLLLWNRLANQSQILCGASLGRGNESLSKWSRSHDQDGRQAHIW